jgi:tagatose 1,6-diphosphate aldolase
MLHQVDAAVLGEINLRIGYTDNVMFYRGNIGFTVYPAHRGNNYAERSCRLLIPLIQHHGLYPVWLTCNVDNTASRKTIENLGALYVETREMPADFPYSEYYPAHARVKRRYCWKVDGL